MLTEPVSKHPLQTHTTCVPTSTCSLFEAPVCPGPSSEVPHLISTLSLCLLRTFLHQHFSIVPGEAIERQGPGAEVKRTSLSLRKMRSSGKKEVNLSRGMRCWDRWQVRGVSQPGLLCQNTVTPPAHLVYCEWGLVCVELAQKGWARILDGQRKGR